MSESRCPYCNSIQSMLLGHVYCSNQAKSMGELDTGTLFIRSRSLEETDDHISRLSIRCMLNGEQRYNVGGREKLVTPRNFLVVNQGQHYRTSFSSDHEQEMILVAFKPGFAEDILYAGSNREEVLLDDPFHTPSKKVMFFEQTYAQDHMISSLFGKLRSLINDRQQIEGTDLDSLYTALLSRLIELHYGLKSDMEKLSSRKPSTRNELYRRLHIARDYMEAHTEKRLDLNDIAHAACLSVHHFKREFNALFGRSPHRYLTDLRMEKARDLLENGSLPVEDISLQAGFENSSAFIRAFKTHTGITPGKYRQVN